MTMLDFLEALHYALGNMDSGQKDDILSEFQDHFAMAKKEGKTEDEICRSLGDPTAIASQFLTKESEYIGTDTSQSGQGNGSIPARQDSGMSGDSNPRAQNYIVDLQKKFDAAAVTLVDIDIQHGDIKLGATSESEIFVSIHGRAIESRFRMSCENGRLSIQEEKQPFNIMRLFRLRKQDIVVTVLLPVGAKTSITARNSMGNTDISKASGILLKIRNAAGNIDIGECIFNHVNAKSSAGNVNLRACSADQFEIKSSAGNVNVSNTTGTIKAHSAAGNVVVESAAGKMDLHTAAGDIKVQDTTGDIEAHTTAGNVRIDSRQSSVNIIAKSTAGEVNIRAVEISRLEAQSSAGTVTVHTSRLVDGRINTMAGDARLYTEAITGRVIVKTSMGTAQVAIPQDAAVRIKASASMGTARVEIPGDQNANATLEVFTSMGDAVVRAI